MNERVAIITYETPFAPCGGIASVLSHLPGSLRSALGQAPAVITPYHHRMESTTTLEMSEAGSFRIPYAANGNSPEKQEVRVTMSRYDDQGCPFYFLRAEDEDLFAGFPHPYAISNLLRDSLFFGAAAVKALEDLYGQTRCVLLLQDWEAATTALALGTRRSLYRAYITLHNSYDSGELYAEDLETVGIDPQSCRGPEPGSGVLERAIPLVQEPVLTVSEQFALDLKEDILETEIRGPQLQRAREFNPVGINNGPFSELQFNRRYTAQGTASMPSLRQWKLQERSRLLDALEKRASGDGFLWGDLSRFCREELPWFVMSGRDDQRQKGYDVAAEAANRFLEEGGHAQFLFFPIPGERGMERLDFLNEMAGRYPSAVVVAPSLAKEDFSSALHGGSYGLMPSLYEPFGMAHEFYMNGILAIGRATGGIIQQVVPLHGAGSFSPAVRRMAARWHDASSRATGILYRESEDIPSALEDWKKMNEACRYIGPTAPNEAENATFRSMCEELLVAMKDGVRIFMDTPELYYDMLLEGVAHMERTLSWEKTAAEYLRSCKMRPQHSIDEGGRHA